MLFKSCHYKHTNIRYVNLSDIRNKNPHITISLLCNKNILYFIFYKTEIKQIFIIPEQLVLSSRVSMIARLLKNPPSMQEIHIQFLGEEEPLEKG